MSNFRVAYPVGNTLGRDHQYWPTLTRSELRAILVAELDITETNEQNRFIDARWPAGVSLEVLMSMAWRVREWTVDASSFTYTGEEFNPPNGSTYSIGGTLPELTLKTRRVKVPADPDNPLREVTDERDILGPASDKNLSFIEGVDKWQTLRNAGVSDVADPDDINLTGSNTAGSIPLLTPPFLEPGGTFEIGFLGQYVIYDPNFNLFYPPFHCDGIFERLIGSIGNSSGGKVILKTLPVTPTGTPSDTPQGNLTIVNPIVGQPDIVIPLGLRGSGAGTHPPIWFPGSGTINLTMTPTRFWPYKNSAGLPVYSESTGSELRSPFS